MAAFSSLLWARPNNPPQKRGRMIIRPCILPGNAFAGRASIHARRNALNLSLFSMSPWLKVSGFAFLRALRALRG
jgi:hypothetical protein